MIFHVDPRGGLPIYRQLVDQVRLAMARGTLAPDDRLPSVREVSKSLALNPATVQKAWQVLERQGVVEHRRGLGVFVIAGGGLSDRDGARKHVMDSARRLAAEGIALGLDAGALADLVRRSYGEMRKGGR